jgi:hypothetical protein
MNQSGERQSDVTLFRGPKRHWFSGTTHPRGRLTLTDPLSQKSET